MKLFNRSVLMKTHALLAVFVLPVAIMFFVTGALYTWGIKGSYDISVHELHLKKPIHDEHNELVTLAEIELKKLNIATPTGEAKIKRIGSAFKLEWTGSNMDVVLESTPQPLLLKLEVKKASWYRQLVQLHKAKGGTPFKVYAAVLATTLLFVLITGFIMAWQVPSLRKLTLVSAALGIAAFIAMIMFS